MHPFVNIAIKAARRAGKIILQASQRLDRLKISEKSSAQDLVTNIDQAAEDDIIETIHRAYPQHCILAEEMGEITKNDTDIVWIIDPIDGTNNFIRGFPHYCISIAIQRKGIVEHGVIYDPCRDELFTASKGDGAQLNGQRIRVSNCVNLEKSVIGTGFAYKRAGIPTEKYLQKFSIFLQECSIRRAGAAALDLAYIASGRLDGFWEMGLKPWDIAAGSILIREAGGFISDDKGEDHYLSSGKVIAGNVKIYPKLLKILSL